MKHWRSWPESGRVAPVAALAALVFGGVADPAAAQTVNYRLSLAGLPIGSATLALLPSNGTTAINFIASVGGGLELGRIAASGSVSSNDVRAESRSGSGKSATTASLSSKGAAGSSQFNYAGTTSRGPGAVRIAMQGGKVTQEDVNIPDNPAAVRVPLTEAHKSGVVDPLTVLGAAIEPGKAFRPEGLCGRRHAVFTGQARFDLVGTAVGPAKADDLPAGWSAVGCNVTYTPIAGHRIDKASAGAKPRTAKLVFARSADGTKVLLWSLSAPGPIGTFTLSAREMPSF